MRRLALLMRNVFSSIFQSHAVHTAHSDTPLKNENVYMLTQSEMKALLKVASDDSKSRKERKAACRKIFSVARHKYGTHVLVDGSK